MNNIKRPSLFLYFTEGVRALMDYVRGWLFLKSYAFTQRGDGHPVLAVPGLLCTDFSTRMLRQFLNQLGYTAYGWESGRNTGNFQELLQLNERVDALYQKHNQKITLIGWSMGGIYVRELAKQRPELFRQVITMGSPFGNISAPNNVKWIYDLINDPKDTDEAFAATIPNAVPIPTTAIFSKQDGIVPWEACQEKIEDTTHQNREVQGSHCGLGMNPSVFEIVAEKMAAF